MKPVLALIARDLTLALRHGADTVVVVAFFVIAALLFAFGVGPEAGVQSRMAAGVVWTTALLAVLLSLERMFAADFEDGSLDQLIVAVDPLGLVLAKVAAHWLATAVPLLVAAPLVALGLQLPPAGLAPLMIGLALGTPILSLLGAVGSALILGARRGSMLVAILLLPLYVPVLIFGSAAVEAGVLGLDPGTALRVIGGLLLIAGVLCPWAAATALKHAVE